MDEKDIDKNKFSVSFKNNDNEQELKRWILKKAGVIGFNNYMKQLAYEKMLEDETNK